MKPWTAETKENWKKNWRWKISRKPYLLEMNKVLKKHIIYVANTSSKTRENTHTKHRNESIKEWNEKKKPPLFEAHTRTWKMIKTPNLREAGSGGAALIFNQLKNIRQNTIKRTGEIDVNLSLFVV